MVHLGDAPRGALSLQLLQAGAFPTEKERGEGMLHPTFERELARERVAQMRREVERNRLDARSAREARLSRAAALSEEARLAKARLAKARSGGEAVLRGGVLGRGTTFVAALLR
jgi:hypothetical protein